MCIYAWKGKYKWNKLLSSIQSLSHVFVNQSMESLRCHGLQHTRLPYPSLTPRASSNSCPSSWWCHPTISSSVIPFISCLQSFPISGSFPRSQFFTPGDQSIGASASASVLPVNIQSQFPLGWTGDWLSLMATYKVSIDLREKLQLSNTLVASCPGCDCDLSDCRRNTGELHWWSESLSFFW